MPRKERNLMPRTDAEDDYDRWLLDDDDDVDPAELHLPPSLRTGGLAEKIAKALREENQKLRKHFVAFLTSLRSNLERQKGGLGSDDDNGRFVRRNGKVEAIQGRSVFNLILAGDDKDEISEELWESAVADCVSCPALTTGILGRCLPPKLISQAEGERASQSFKFNHNETLAEDLSYFMADLLREPAAGSGLATGIPAFDEATGGLYGCMLLGGETGIGKSALVRELAFRTLLNRDDVAILDITYELSKKQLLRRLLCRQTGMSMAEIRKRLRAGEDKEILHAYQEVRRVYGHRMRIMDQRGRPPLKAAEVYAAWGALRKASGAKYVITIFDNLPRMPDGSFESVTSSETTSRPKNEEEADADRMAFIANLQFRSRDLIEGGYPIFVITEVRKTTPGKRLTGSDVRGSHGHVYRMDSVFLLERTSSSPSKGVSRLTLNVAKVGDGGCQGDVHLEFDFRAYQFHEASKATDAKNVASRPSQPPVAEFDRFEDE